MASLHTLMILAVVLAAAAARAAPDPPPALLELRPPRPVEQTGLLCECLQAQGHRHTPYFRLTPKNSVRDII